MSDLRTGLADRASFVSAAGAGAASAVKVEPGVRGALALAALPVAAGAGSAEASAPFRGARVGRSAETLATRLR